MRETAETPDDVTMTFGVPQPRLAELRVEQDGDVLLRQIFGMGEGKAEKQPQRPFHPIR